MIVRKGDDADVAWAINPNCAEVLTKLILGRTRQIIGSTDVEY
ncbi:hypothetical protein [Paenibacillus donghaensis]|nr:hypothetical protein [Paenibacillus donghaensis]